MKRHEAPMPSRGPTRAFMVSLGLLVIGLVPTTGGGPFRNALRSLHSLDPNRTDRKAQATGYYDGLIDGRTPGRDELTLTLLGKPPGWAQFTDIDAARYLGGQLLQFELKPNLDSKVLGTRFTTNEWGMRDRPYAKTKPPGTFRIALLGSSIDMGWGVDTEQTYENRLEDWLNAYASRRGVTRRFEVLNFAMAAYSPLHRLEVLNQKVAEFEPDLILYAATRLDTRLLQIHVLGLLQDNIDLKYDFLRAAVQASGIDTRRLERDLGGKLRARDSLKAQLEPHLPTIDETILAHVARTCARMGVPLATIIVPRACEDDGPELRADDVARMSAIAAKYTPYRLDLSAAFDGENEADVEIAPWDDHPNARGHQLLFIALGRGIMASPSLRTLLFGTDLPVAAPAPTE